MDRKNYIGSSDIAAVMGMSRWNTPLQVWSVKTGKIEPDDLSENEAVEWGTKLEELVAKKFQEVTGMKVRRSPKRYTHKDHKMFRAQVDRLVEGTDELLECKTSNAWKAKEWEGEEIPQEYILQVMWQLGITGRKVGHIAVLIGGQSFKYKKITFDQGLFDKQIQMAFDFWQMVQDKTPPMALGDDNVFIAELHPENDEQIQAMEEMNDAIATLQTIKSNIGDMLKQKDGIEAKIKQVIGDNLGIKTSEYTVTWKKQQRAEYVVKAAEFRQLRVKKEKSHGDTGTDKRTGTKD